MAETTTTAPQSTTTVMKTTAAAEQGDAWGVTLRLENETPTGAVLVLERSESTEEIDCGSDYIMEQLVSGEWQAVPQKDPDMVVAWTAEAYVIPSGGEYRTEVNWEWLYGSLAPGQYRVGKGVTLFRAPGDLETTVLYAEFAVID